MINIKKEILFGTLLGDANLQTYTGGKTWRIRFIQSNINKSYLFHLYYVFEEFVKTPPKLSYLKSGHSRWTFNTTVQPIALEFSKIFYNNKKNKILPSKEMLMKYLTPLAISYWYMDDGSLKSNCLSYYLCTDSFKLSELKILKEVFKEKYDIDINFHKTSVQKEQRGYRIYIPKRESYKFYKLIEKYIHRDMKYKLGNH